MLPKYVNTRPVSFIFVTCSSKDIDALPYVHIHVCSLRWSVAWHDLLWLSDAIRLHRALSALANVMTCCVTALRHYLNQCWFTIIKIQWYLSDCNFTRDIWVCMYLMKKIVLHVLATAVYTVELINHNFIYSAFAFQRICCVFCFKRGASFEHQYI